MYSDCDFSSDRSQYNDSRYQHARRGRFRSPARHSPVALHDRLRLEERAQSRRDVSVIVRQKQ